MVTGIRSYLRQQVTNDQHYHTTRLAEVAVISHLASKVYKDGDTLASKDVVDVSPNAIRRSSFAPPNLERLPSPPQASWEPYKPEPVPLSVLIARHGSVNTALRMTIAEQRACDLFCSKGGFVRMVPEVQDALRWKLLKHFELAKKSADWLPNIPFAPVKWGVRLTVGMAAGIVDFSVGSIAAGFNKALDKAMTWELLEGQLRGFIVSGMTSVLCAAYLMTTFLSVWTLGDAGTVKVEQHAQEAETNKTIIGSDRIYDAPDVVAKPLVTEPAIIKIDEVDADEEILVSDSEIASDSECSSPWSTTIDGFSDSSRINVDVSFFDGPTIEAFSGGCDESIDGLELGAIVVNDIPANMETKTTTEAGLAAWDEDEVVEHYRLFEGVASSNESAKCGAVDEQVGDEAKCKSIDERKPENTYEYEMDKDEDRRLVALMSNVKLDLASFVDECESPPASVDGCFRESKSSPAILVEREDVDDAKFRNAQDEANAESLVAVDDIPNVLVLVLPSIDQATTGVITSTIDSKCDLVVDTKLHSEPSVPVVKINCAPSAETRKHSFSRLTPSAPAFVPRALQAPEKVASKSAFRLNPQTAPIFVPQQSGHDLPCPPPQVHLRPHVLSVTIPSRPSTSAHQPAPPRTAQSKVPSSFQPQCMPPALLPNSKPVHCRGSLHAISESVDFTHRYVDGSADKLREQGPPSFWAPPVAPESSSDQQPASPEKKKRRRRRRRSKKSKAKAESGGHEAVDDDEAAAAEGCDDGGDGKNDLEDRIEKA